MWACSKVHFLVDLPTTEGLGASCLNPWPRSRTVASQGPFPYPTEDCATREPVECQPWSQDFRTLSKSNITFLARALFLSSLLLPVLSRPPDFV